VSRAPAVAAAGLDQTLNRWRIRMSKKINVHAAVTVKGSRYPSPYDKPCAERVRCRIGDVAGLTQFGVNIVRLPPGCWSSQRHWHSGEDEFVFVIEGEVVLVTDSGEEVLSAGDCAGFKAAVSDGHHLQNRSGRDALVLEVGSRRPDEDQVIYPDIDLQFGRAGFAHRNGELYTEGESRK
jgi:uncharacterized cupin superfamily protein